MVFIDEDGQKRPDYMEDEQLLLIDTPEGLCLFAGCCHPGILNCLSHVKRSFPQKKLHMILAGMHLMGASGERLERTIGELKKLDWDLLIPVHCTGVEAIGRMKMAFGEKCRLVETGVELS